ncbi:MAG: serine/threonine protein kinase [Bradymonadia bacterium]
MSDQRKPTHPPAPPAAAFTPAPAGAGEVTRVQGNENATLVHGEEGNPEQGNDDKTIAGGPPSHDEHLKGENYGKWAEPTIKKKKKADPMLGRTIAGRYEVLGILGKGGMGAVYKARQPSVQRLIALKVLLKEYAENETIIKRFHQEALAASRLTHPNTISVYDFGQTEDNILYMAMELLRGESLARTIAREGAMAPKRAIHIMRQCCKSLAEAHKAGIIHRDLKPDNIMLTEIEGERDFVKVLDFGVAKLKEYEGKEGTLTQAGMIFGTPKYMSPEQARSGDLDSRSDVYALGIMLYEMLMGKPPFVGDNPLSILIAHVNENPQSFARFNPEVSVPEPLERVVQKAITKARESRHQSVEEMLRELDAVDELLDGATYDAVASRLPASVPGADGSPSLAGPAIVAPMSDGTAPGPALGPERGGTLLLDDQGNVIDQNPMEIGSHTQSLEAYEEPEQRGGRIGFLVAAGLGLPAVAFGAWLFTQGPSDDPEKPPKAIGPVVGEVLDASVAKVTPDAAVAVVAKPDAAVAVVASPDAAVAKAVPDAAVKVAAEPKKPRPPKKATEKKATIRVTGGTMGVTVKTLGGPKVGVASPSLGVTVKKKTRYVLSKPGYIDAIVTVDPKKSKSLYEVRLKPKSGGAPITSGRRTSGRRGGTTATTNPIRTGPNQTDIGRDGRSNRDNPEMQ